MCCLLSFVFVGCLLFVVANLLLVVCCLLLLFFVVSGLMLVVRCSLLLFVVVCWLLSVVCLLFERCLSVVVVRCMFLVDMYCCLWVVAS